MPFKKEDDDFNKKHPNLTVRESPNSYDAEAALLASMLMDGPTAYRLAPLLSADDFYTPAHKTIFMAMHKLFLKARPLDIVTVANMLDDSGELALCGGVEYLAKIVDALPSVANADYYYATIKKLSKLRSLIAIAKKMADRAYAFDPEDKALKDAEDELYKLSQEGSRGNPEIVGGYAKQALADLQDRVTNPKSRRGVPTGFVRLDTVLGGGFQPSDLIILAARPGQGKTSFAMNCAVNAALTTKPDGSGKYRVAVFSLEMSALQLANRMMCSLANYDMSLANRAIVSERDWDRLYAAEKKLSSVNLYIDETGGITPPEIVSKCRALKRNGGLDFVLIDYLQLMRSGKQADNFVREIADMTWALKLAAKELQVPILLLSQMSRSIEQRGAKDKESRLSDLRDSGAIEQDADIVMFIDKREDKTADKKPESRSASSEVFLNLAKHRNGETGYIKLIWHPSTVTFSDAKESPDDSGVQRGKDVKAYGFDDPPPPPPGDAPPDAPPEGGGEGFDPEDSGLL